MTAVFGRVRVGAGHHDVDLGARIARATGPPFFTVQDPVIAVLFRAQRDVRRVRAGLIRFGHQIGRADLAVQQRFQPAVLMGLRAVALEHLHIARVRRGAVEHLGRDADLAHFLCQIGVFHGGQPVALVAVGQPKVPEAPLFRLGFEPVDDFQLTIRVLKPVARGVFSHLGVVFCIQRFDIFVNHFTHSVDKRADAVGDA